MPTGCSARRSGSRFDTIGFQVGQCWFLRSFSNLAVKLSNFSHAGPASSLIARQNPSCCRSWKNIPMIAIIASAKAQTHNLGVLKIVRGCCVTKHRSRCLCYDQHKMLLMQVYTQLAGSVLNAAAALICVYEDSKSNIIEQVS